MSRDRKTRLAIVQGRRRRVPFRLFSPSTWGQFLPAEKVAEVMAGLSHEDWLDLGYVVRVDNRSIVIYKMQKSDRVTVEQFVEQKRTEANQVLNLG